MSKIGAEHYSVRKDIGSTDLELPFSVIRARDSVPIDEIIPIPIVNGVPPCLRQGQTPIHLPVVGEALPES
jgi:hypothetical protein